jgi:hypothetical protein
VDTEDIGFTPGLKGTPEYEAKAYKAEYADMVADLLEQKENMEGPINVSEI